MLSFGVFCSSGYQIACRQCMAHVAILAIGRGYDDLDKPSRLRLWRSHSFVFFASSSLGSWLWCRRWRFLLYFLVVKVRVDESRKLSDEGSSGGFWFAGRAHGILDINFWGFWKLPNIRVLLPWVSELELSVLTRKWWSCEFGSKIPPKV
jgi:hypothetical protein